MSQDAVRCKTWSLAAHAASFSPHHRDSNGLNTWIQALSGLKVWACTTNIEGIMDMERRRKLDNTIFDDEAAMFAMRQEYVMVTTGTTM